MLRKFSPALLDALELTQDIEGEQSACLRALQMLKELNAAGRRKLPEDAPTEFLPQRLSFPGPELFGESHVLYAPQLSRPKPRRHGERRA